MAAERDVRISRPATLYFPLWGWMKSEFTEKKVDTRDELLARILDAAASAKRLEDQLK
jgi:hypothetical protein